MPGKALRFKLGNDLAGCQRLVGKQHKYTRAVERGVKLNGVLQLTLDAAASRQAKTAASAVLGWAMAAAMPSRRSFCGYFTIF